MRTHLKNFLHSGYTFEDDEYELQSKYILFNSMLGISVLIILTITFFQLTNNDNVLKLNMFQMLAAILGMYSMRKSKKYFELVLYTTSFLAIVTLFVTIMAYPSDYMRIVWFLILVVIAFLLNGKQLGYPIAFVSLLVIAVAFLSNKAEVDMKAYLLLFGFVLLVTILVQLYDNREQKIKQRLHWLNQNLEKRVAEETKERMKLLEESNQKLEEMAHYDALTKLPNRVLFFDRLDQSIRKAKRNKTKLAILFFDIDNFKEINDSFGHMFGDKILVAFSERLQGTMRHSDSLGRFGGDEFIAIIEDIREMSAIVRVAQAIDQVFLEPIQIEEKDFYLTVSIGVAVYPDDGLDSETLIKNADVAMYAAKNNGRNRVSFYTKEMTEYSKQKLMIDHQIRLGIQNDEFIVHYQPVINNHDHSLAGLEALIRWNHPEKGMIMPDGFIPIAEMSTHIIGLGEAVLRCVSDQISLWNKEGFNPPYISVNISPKQLRDDDLLPLLERTLDRVAFRRDWLEIEITEGYAIENLSEAIKKLHAIRQLGISLSLDDFGTGYSSLSYLKKLPINKLKIDRSFIRDIVTDAEDRILVKAIITFSKELKLSVVAEGVEDTRQLTMIKEMGCELTQGYYFGKPMPSLAIEEYFFKSEEKNG